MPYNTFFPMCQVSSEDLENFYLFFPFQYPLGPTNAIQIQTIINNQLNVHTINCDKLRWACQDQGDHVLKDMFGWFTIKKI